MKKFIKVTALLLVALLIALVVPLNISKLKVEAAGVSSGLCGDNVSFNLSLDGVLTISGCGDMYDVEDGYALPFDTTPWDRDKVTRVVINEGVTGIGEYMFSSHTYLMDIKIAKSVTSIGMGAFQRCPSLHSLTLPENLTAISKNMCALTGLRFVYIPEKVKVVNSGAFYSVDTLLEVAYGGTKAQWKSIKINSNNKCLSKAYMVYNGGITINKIQSGKCGKGVTWKLSTNGTLKISGKGNMDSYDKSIIGDPPKKNSTGKDHPWYKYRSKIKKIIISSNVTSVGAYAFFDCFNCTSLEIQNGVQTIKDGSFSSIPISSLSLPNSVSSVGEYAFSHCGALKNVKLSDNIKVLDEGVFINCFNLKSIVLPKKLTEIRNAALVHSDFDEISIPASVKIIDTWSLGSINTVRFLGALPLAEYNELPDTFIDANYCYCPPQYYKDYKACFEKWRAKGVLSDGPIRAKLNKTSLTLTADKPTYQLSVSNETDSTKFVTKKWWVEKPKVATINKKGLVTASGHGKTMLHVEISSNGYHSMANCEISTKRNDLMVALLPKKIKADFPVAHSIRSIPFGEVDFDSYQPEKYAETNIKNKYYQQILSLTNDLISGCTSDKQKAKAIWNWVTENITYGGAITSGAYETFLEREAHCEGYSKLTGLMLYLADIPSCLVTSYDHMWNIALLDGKWTMLDSTNHSFGEDYNDYDAIETMGFGIDDFCFVLDNTEGIKLTGVGNYYYDEERQNYTYLNIPNFVDIIFGNAFDGCDDLKSIILPKGISKINSNAFSDCNNLTNVFYAGSKSQWKNIDINNGNENLTEAKITFKTTKIMPTVKLSNVTSNGKVKLQWNDIGASNYQVYRAASKNGDFKHIKTTSKKGYTDVSAVAGKKYFYKVRGVFSDGNKSAFSKTKSTKAVKSAKSFKLSTTVYTYNGKVKTPSVTVKDFAGKVLKKNTDYTVIYASGRKNVGTYKVTIKMLGKYTGTKTLTFKINPAKISSYKLSATSYTYDGKVKTPSVTVKNASGTKLTKNTHYTVTYTSGRKNVGTYKVTIKGKGNYTGTKTLTFKINPAKTTVSKLTAGKKSITVSITKKSAQVSGYQIQYSTNKNFSKATTKTISSYKTTKYTLKSLSAKKTYYVRVRTYKTVDKTKYYSGWSTYKYVKTK